MTSQARRQFLTLAAKAAAATFPLSIQRALAVEAARKSGTIADVQHVVILMLENRSFDHYFGTLAGIRGFRDRHPAPCPAGEVFRQSLGEQVITPFHLDSATTSALKVQPTPHNFDNAQAAWNQGRLDRWPEFKTPLSMGHYRRADIPFQFALAEAFTLCDAYHCSVATGTQPNRIMFWSGANFDPERRALGLNATDADSEPVNLRCWIEGALPEPGYTYAGSGFGWPTVPDVLEGAKVDWRIYQDPNDNWTGAMHGGLAFESFRTARPGSAIYERGMRHWSLERFADDAAGERLPQVSWVVPSQATSEHPAGSSPLQGAELTSRVLDALTQNPEVWARTVLFVTFDENDGFFDHAPPPAPPSYDADGAPAGKATLDLAGMYFSDPDRKYILPNDPSPGLLRPWGLGARVPMYVISPWSKGGWVNSQVFDHTSVGQFIEKRFGVTVPAISPWHRAVCGDLTSCFDFSGRDSRGFPKLPQIRNAAALAAEAEKKPAPAPPASAEPPFQEPGIRRSRALPYELHVHAPTPPGAGRLTLSFHNTGRAGAVFHVYDKLHLDRIPRRYTVEAGKALTDHWLLHADEERYDLWVYGPNGFVREFRGLLKSGALPIPEIALEYDIGNRSVRMVAANRSRGEAMLAVRANAYRTDGPWPLRIAAGRRAVREWFLIASHGWYDFTVAGEHFERRFAGRMETGKDGFSDPHA